MPRAFLVVHFGAGAGQPLRIVLFRDRAGERRSLAASDAAFGKPLGDAILDHLADGAELFADRLGLPHQRIEHDVRFALLVAEIAAGDLLRRLKLAIDAAVALFQPGGFHGRSK